MHLQIPLWTYVYISLGLYQGMEWLGHIVSVYLIIVRSWRFFSRVVCHFTYSSTVYESSCSCRSSQTLGILSRKNYNVLHRTPKFPTVSKNLSKTRSVQFSCSVVSDSLWPRGLQDARLPCPSPTPGPCSNSCPSSQRCHPTILSSFVLFSAFNRDYYRQIFKSIIIVNSLSKISYRIYIF